MSTTVLALSVLLLTDSTRNVKEDMLYCDSVLTHASANRESIDSIGLIMLFTAVAGKRCENNAEFGEASNELLFRLIYTTPVPFFSTLFAMSRHDIAAVKRKIDHPVHDAIPVIRIYESVQQTTMPDSLKMKALQLMDHAYRREKEMIQSWEEENKMKWEYPPWD